MLIEQYQPESDIVTDYLEEMSKFTFTSKYPRYNEEKQRRNTFDETVDLVKDMHDRRYGHLFNTEQRERFEWAFNKVKEGLDLPAMRSLQFAGPAIEAHHARLYNCSMRHVDSIRAFAEIFYLLMCGSGVTFGLNKKYMSRLPDLVSQKDKTGAIITYVVEDSIEGWADSIEALLMCYFRNTPYSGRKIVFDYSKIRKKGELLKTSGGRAPGHEGLKQSLQRIKDHLDFIIEKKGLSRLRSIDIYDIIMHLSDAVLSGGIRRAATMAIFEPNDLDMKNAKGLISIERYRNFHKDEESKFYEGFVWVEGKRYEVTIDQKFSDFEYEQMKKDRVIAWHHVYPWRARSNNSMILKRGKFSFDEFKEIFETVKLWGEPGFLFAYHEDTLFNPCVTGDTLVAVADGRNAVPIKQLSEENYTGPIYTIKDGKTVIGNCSKVWKTRENASLVEIELDDGSKLRCTPDHKIMLRNGEYLSACDLKENDSLMPFNSYESNNRYRQISSNTGRDRRQYRMIADYHNILDGKHEKDYAIHHKDFNGKNDKIDNLFVMLHSDHKNLHSERMKGGNNSVFKIKNIEQWKRRLSSVTFGKNNPNYNGVSSEIFVEKLKSETSKLGRNLLYKEALSLLDIKNLSKGRIIEISKILGITLTKNKLSYLLDAIANQVGVETGITERDLQSRQWKEKGYNTYVSGNKILVKKNCKYCNKDYEKSVQKINSDYCSFHCYNESRKESQQVGYNHKVKQVTFLDYKEDVYDLTVDGTHNFGIITSNDDADFIKSSGIFIHNCAEVVTIPVTDTGVCGVQMCNLVTQNGSRIDTIEKFLESVEASTIIGTLQAGYTDFKYLSNASKQLTEEEALLGVSITGIYDNPDILLDERNLHVAAKWAVEVNKKWAKIIGINQAARVTLIKPEGTASLVLKSASGIHPHHAKPKYFRRIQANKTDPVFQYFKKINPHMIEESVWSSTKTDDVITFPVEIPDHVKVKADLSAIDHLNDIRKVYENWVKPGTTDNNKKPLTHNVSATVIVKDDEWDDVARYVFDNQNSFGGLSFISAMGDKMYKQAPLEKVSSEEDLIKWNDIVKNFKKVDYTNINESEDNTSRQEEVACAGGACSI